MNQDRHPENTFPTGLFRDGASGEESDGASAGPDDIVNAEGAGEFRRVLVIGGKRFEVWPGETHAEGPPDHGENKTGGAGEKNTGTQAADHQNGTERDRSEETRL